ncbi:MAG: hypothetical protein IJR77_03635 [Bacteroidales bacterium]|nr:hypothetical protein [Bacteroidales bacterium]
MTKARIERDDNGVHRVFVQRGKFKHWFELGAHKPTDVAFAQALAEDKIEWHKTIVRTDILFTKIG